MITTARQNFQLRGKRGVAVWAPYGVAALPRNPSGVSMQWDWTVGGTRRVTGSPLSFDHTAMPTFGGTTHNCTTQAQVNTALSDAVAGDIISINADLTITAAFTTLPDKGSSGFVKITTDLSGALPTWGGDYMTATKATHRIDPTTHAGALRTITINTTSPIPAFTCAQGARGWWIDGLKIVRTSAAGNEGLVDFGAATMTQESHMPSRLALTRCVLDGGNNARRGLNLNCMDALVAHNYITGAASSLNGWSDSQGIAWWRGGKHLLIYNNRTCGESECIATGGSDTSITNFLPADWAVIRNVLAKESAWDSDVTYPLKKNMYEQKVGERCLVMGNVLDRYRSSSGGQFYQWAFTPTNQDNGNSWNAINDINIIGNLSVNATEGGVLQINPQGSSGNTNAGGARFTFAQNYHKDGSNDATTSRCANISAGGSGKNKHWPDVCIEHNTVPAADAWVVLDDANMNGQSAWLRFKCRDNANWKAPTYGPVFSSGGVNATALDNCLGSGNWTHAKNAQVSGGASWSAAGSLAGAPHNCIQDTASALFTDPGTNDWSAKAGGPLDNAATDGQDIGADVDWVVNTLTAGLL